MDSPIERICPSFRVEFLPNSGNHFHQIFTGPNEPMAPLLGRHNSEPDLGTSIGQFLTSWNCKNEAEAILSPSTRLPFWSSKSNRPSPHVSQQFAMDKARAPLCLPLPQFRHQAKFIRSPFAPLPFDRPRIRPCQQYFSPADCRDGDLLPSCWFSFDSEDLNRLHYKLQRRISRRRSLSKANCPFGEQNPGRAKIIEKYQRLRGGIRRALSDHQLLFMDPKRDIGEEILQRRGEKGNKRVSFSSPAAKGQGGSGKTIKRNKSSASLQMEFSFPQKEAHPAKPILARKSSAATLLQPPNAGGAFRHRTGTIASTGNCDDYSICPMDYATFRAWRRGSRLSIDVLNNAICQSGEGEAIRKCRQPQGGLLGNWMGMLKRVLADCIQQRRPPELSCLQKAAAVN